MRSTQTQVEIHNISIIAETIFTSQTDSRVSVFLPIIKGPLKFASRPHGRKENAKLEAQRKKEFKNLESNNKRLKEKLTKFQSINNQLDVNLNILKFEFKKNKNLLHSDTANGEDKEAGE